MTYLGLLLAVKIATTLAIVCMPLLFIPSSTLLARTQLTAASLPWLRLYGVAMVALVVGYAYGLWSLGHGIFPWGVVLMGIVSNIGASLTLLATGLWKRMRGITVLYSSIGLALVLAALIPSLASTRVF